MFSDPPLIGPHPTRVNDQSHSGRLGKANKYHHGTLLNHPLRESSKMSEGKNCIPENVHKIHLIAVCGTGMGALACMLKCQGFDISGSDQKIYPPMSDFLREQGIHIMNGFEAAHLSDRPDMVIVGNAVTRENPEAKKNPIWAYGLIVEVEGQKDGKPARITLKNSHPSMNVWGGKSAYGKNVGIPLSIGAQMIAKGKVKGKGVFPPEASLDPAEFFIELSKRRITIHERMESHIG